VPPKIDQFKKPEFAEFVALQSTQGFWQVTSLSDLQKFFKSQLPTHLESEVICTLAALIILEQFFADRQDEWQLISKKAKTYLKSQGVALKKELDALALLV
jgi:hypothetical protein